MNKTKIEWCTMTWNPVTGCYHNCPYCYAARIARRFREKYVTDVPAMPHIKRVSHGKCYELAELCKAAYPFGFTPTMHRYRLDEPQLVKKPQNIFVCSMADLFGEWVPDEWIKAVFEACAKAPWHRYLFLTKNPDRYWQINSEDKDTKPLNLYETDKPLQIYLGASVTNNKQFDKAHASVADWISIEPLLEELYTDENFMTFRLFGNEEEIPRWKWVVIGAETGNRKDKVIPQREWIEAIVEECGHWGTPVFMKDSLKEIWGKPLIREYPWEEKA